MKDLIRKYSEFVTIPIALIVWFGFLWLAKEFGLSTYDTGIFQKLIFAVVAVFVIKGLAWLVLSLDQPQLKSVLDPENEKKWFYLNEKERFHYAFLLYALYFAAFVLIVALV